MDQTGTKRDLAKEIEQLSDSDRNEVMKLLDTKRRERALAAVGVLELEVTGYERNRVLELLRGIRQTGATSYKWNGGTERRFVHIEED